YNAIQNLATLGDNIYGRNWAGPKPAQVDFDLYNQAAAAQILVDGIGFPRQPSTSLTVDSPTKPSSAIIAGATIGSLVSLSSIILAVLYAVRRRRQRDRTAPSSESDPISAIDPFVSTAFEKTTAFPHKYPAVESRTQVTRPEARLEPLRHRDSGLSEAANSTGNPRGSLVLPNYGPDPAGGDIEMTPGFPDM
ncbi:hypothetical protein PQX77_020144, partial [Marasmius sp. AFHP31]